MSKIGWCGSTGITDSGDPPDFWEQDERNSEDDSPYCECQLEAMEDEDAENQCACCGKPLR